MIYGSVCSGIEAATVAWHPLGWRPAFFAEIEAFPSAVLKHHYPDVRNVGDFTGLIHAAAPVPSIDVLVGGTPCQSFSVAGLRRGLADARGGLTLEFVRLAQRLRPKWIVWENVPGVLSQDGGRAFGAFLGALGELGYGWAYRVLDAQYFGVAQRRRRVFVVGCARGDFARAAAVLFEPEGVRRDPPTRRAAGQRAAAAPVTGAQGGSGGLGAGLDGGVGGVAVAHVDVLPTMVSGGSTDGSHNQLSGQLREQYIVPHIVAPPLTATQADVAGPLDSHYYKGPGSRQGGEREYVAHVVAPPQTEYPEGAEVCGTLSDGAHNGGGLNGQDAYTGRVLPVAFDARQSDTIVYGDRTGPLDTDGHSVGVCVTGDRTHAPVSVAQNQLGEVRLGEVMGTLNTNTNASGRNTPMALQTMAVRRLTPVECERLQGFPDNYTRISWKRKSASECPDGPRYKALGNSMAVPVMRWIGERIAKVEAV